MCFPPFHPALCALPQAEEARFRAQLQELEQQRMGMIEAAWRSREGQRQSEIAAMKAKYAALEKQTRELLVVTQERERVLLASEAELRLRKAGLEREAAARMTEAEAAVRRLQVCGGVVLGVLGLLHCGVAACLGEAAVSFGMCKGRLLYRGLRKSKWPCAR
jgi:hypothetical protein